MWRRPANATNYDRDASSERGHVVSDNAALTLCIADWYCSGAVSGKDVSAFSADYLAGSAIADLNGDAVADSTGLVEFMSLWDAGCP